MRATPLILSLFALTLAAGPGCDKIKKAVDKGKSVANEVDKATGGKKGNKHKDPEARALAKASKKMNVYVGCLNGFAANIGRARGTYLRWVDPAKGPTGKERHIYGIHKINLDPDKRCGDKVAKFKGKEPSMPELEAAADAYVAELRKAEAVINVAYDYYKQKRYEADGFAKGKELHPQLMKAFESFAKADAEFGRQFDAEDDALADRRLKMLKRLEGRKLRYKHLLMMTKAKQMLRATRTSSALDLADVDLEALQTAVNTYASAYRASSAYAKTHPKELKSAKSYKGVKRDGGKLLKAAEAMVARKKAGKAFTGRERELKSGHPEQLEGHPAAVMDAYNDLINSSNTLRM